MAENTKIHFEVRRLRLKQTWTIARGSSDYRDNVFVTLERNGVIGYGEAAPNPRYGESADTVVQFLKKAVPVLEKNDWLHLVDVNAAISGLESGNFSAKAAIDIALLDWFCKSHAIPLYQHLGLDPLKTAVTFYSIGIDSPHKIKEKVQQARDFPILKIKAGLENDEEVIAAVRSVTDKPICIDANEGWRDKHVALEKLQWLQGQNVEFVEQPMHADQLSDIAWLRERAELPIIADESVIRANDIPNLARAFDGINIKLMKAGGIQETLRMIWLAKSLDMKIMLGCMIESSVAVSAAAQLSPLVDYADLDGNLLIDNDPFSGVTVEQGKLILPQEPGIGATPND
ncbi:dipeptide epimerase [candidate division KSB1 bacterium]|nr:dipeptide epimerase [candidate division KSB1 bacterium]NIR70115.1 dipeptide epimerase [candidate division KSB1 bacterium]NIS27540.1 dipeptide epimerase [candidate division KSB1 bacterium]NIT74391.1 dipeptide epimerase [candidate division KSB1 bacterium]NIU28258.1 dipeptide epimerase [candidate division KSB1 bacterium]